MSSTPPSTVHSKDTAEQVNEAVLLHAYPEAAPLTPETEGYAAGEKRNMKGTCGDISSLSSGATRYCIKHMSSKISKMAAE